MTNDVKRIELFARYELIQEMEIPELAKFLRKVSDCETEFTIWIVNVMNVLTIQRCVKLS